MHALTDKVLCRSIISVKQYPNSLLIACGINSFSNLIITNASGIVLLQAAQEDLKKRYSASTPQSKKTQIWRNIKSGLGRFCQAVYNYSSVMDVLASSHPEIASLACKLHLLAIRCRNLSKAYQGVP